MLRYLSSALALFLLFTIANPSTACATTVIPTSTKCPVCDKSFVTMAIGSYSNFGEQARDLSSSPFARFTKAQTCPYCLYSALNSDFDKVTPAEKDALRKSLANFVLKPLPEEAKALAAAQEDSRLRDQDYLGLLIARQCNALRKPDAQREFNLSLLLFYQSKYLQCDELHVFYRKRAIEALQRQFDSGRFVTREQAVFTYLLGELLRQDGQNDSAIQQFTRAAEIAGPLSASTPKDSKDSCQWIIDWSREQSDQARSAKESATKSIEQGSGATKVEPWRRIGEYENPDNPENAAILKQYLPELNRYPFSEVEGHPTETLKDVADRSALEPGRLLELNPRFKAPTDKIDSRPLRIIRTPLVWTETRLMANLHRLIRSGDPQAIEYFFRWCQTVGPASLGRSEYNISACLDALAASTAPWSVPADLPDGDVAEQPFLICCLRYLRGDNDATQELLAALQGTSKPQASLAADCFSIRRDAAVKEAILKHWAAGKQYEWYTQHKVHNYLSLVATPQDLPRIEAIAAQEKLDRHDIEQDILIKVRLQELLRRSLRTQATTTP